MTIVHNKFVGSITALAGIALFFAGKPLISYGVIVAGGFCILNSMPKTDPFLSFKSVALVGLTCGVAGGLTLLFCSQASAIPLLSAAASLCLESLVGQIMKWKSTYEKPIDGFPHKLAVNVPQNQTR